jgi:hypothetical protein
MMPYDKHLEPERVYRNYMKEIRMNKEYELSTMDVVQAANILQLGLTQEFKQLDGACWLFTYVHIKGEIIFTNKELDPDPKKTLRHVRAQVEARQVLIKQMEGILS